MSVRARGGAAQGRRLVFSECNACKGWGDLADPLMDRLMDRMLREGRRHRAEGVMLRNMTFMVIAPRLVKENTQRNNQLIP